MVAKRILIVEDQQDSGQMLQAGLETLEADLDVTLVDSAEQALEAHKLRPVDLLVADVLLPGLTGLELMQRVQRSNPDAQVILLSGTPDAEIRKAVARAGAQAFFFKPLQLADFLDAVERILGLVETSLPLELEAVRQDLAEAEDQVGGVSGLIERLRVQVNAMCVALINEQGRLVVRSGALPEPTIEFDLMPDLMAGFFSAARISAFMASPTPDNLLCYRGATYQLYLCSIGPAYALLLATPVLPLGHLAALAKACHASVLELAPAISKLEQAFHPAPVSAEGVTNQVDEKLEDLLAKAETKPMDRRKTESFWESSSQELLVGADGSNSLSYAQAAQLGLAPSRDGKSQ
jgi:DNA-binding response OmpR family regulator